MRGFKKFCITGGPCAGKSTSLSYVSQKLSERGFLPLIVPEAATLMMSGNAKPDILGAKTFQTAVMRTIRDIEKNFEYCAYNAPPTLTPVLITDRGVCDAKAYMIGDLYQEVLRASGYDSEVMARDEYYDAVFHLVTAARGAEAYYTTANNTIRLEAPGLARELDERTMAAWIGHPHLRVIDNSTDFEGKLKRLDREICAALGIPVPLEIERRFLCKPVDIWRLPKGTQQIEIEQIYLMGEPEIVPRVRKRGQNGAFTYYHTVKRDLAVGIRSEIERVIDEREYAWSQQFRRPGSNIVHKRRFCFVHESQYFELDAFPPSINHAEEWILEIELTEADQMLSLPSYIDVVEEVTGKPEYSNFARALSRA